MMAIYRVSDLSRDPVRMVPIPEDDSEMGYYRDNGPATLRDICLILLVDLVLVGMVWFIVWLAKEWIR